MINKGSFGTQTVINGHGAVVKEGCARSRGRMDDGLMAKDAYRLQGQALNGSVRENSVGL